MGGARIEIGAAKGHRGKRQTRPNAPNVRTYAPARHYQKDLSPPPQKKNTLTHSHIHTLTHKHKTHHISYVFLLRYMRREKKKKDTHNRPVPLRWYCCNREARKKIRTQAHRYTYIYICICIYLHTAQHTTKHTPPPDSFVAHMNRLCIHRHKQTTQSTTQSTHIPAPTLRGAHTVATT